jgi:hypothetical protein
MSQPGLPSLILIGADHAGLPALCAHLNAHPQIAVRESDSEFFASSRSWSRGLEGYRALFSAGARVIGECAPSCTRMPRVEGVAERLHEALPKARLVYLMRDPIQRIVDAYTALVAAGTEDRTFRAAIASLRDNPYVDQSRYHLQLEPFWKVFGHGRVHLLTRERLNAAPRETLSALYRFARVDADFFDAEIDRQMRQDGEAVEPAKSTPLRAGLAWLKDQIAAPRLESSQPKIDAELHARLDYALSEDLRCLRAATGERFSDWSL